MKNTIPEDYLRIFICEMYTESDHYIFHKNEYFKQAQLLFIEKDSIINNTFTGERITRKKLRINDIDVQLSELIKIFNRTTGIPHSSQFDDKDGCKINFPEYLYDSFPLTIKNYYPQMPNTLTLSFNLNDGIEKQIKKAKKKIIKERLNQKQIHDNDFDNHSQFYTTRKTIQDISNDIFVVSKRDSIKRSNKSITWDGISQIIKMNKETAKKHYQNGNKLINSGEIIKFFPIFKEKITGE